MIRKMLMGVGLAIALAFAVGCEKAKETASTATQKTSGAMEKGKEMAKEGMEKAREMTEDAAKYAKTNFLAPIEKMFPDVEAKIKGLTGESQTKATELFTSLKKLIEDFKASPKEKFESLMEGITAKVAELKKAVGL